MSMSVTGLLPMPNMVACAVPAAQPLTYLFGERFPTRVKALMLTVDWRWQCPVTHYGFSLCKQTTLEPFQKAIVPDGEHVVSRCNSIQSRDSCMWDPTSSLAHQQLDPKVCGDTDLDGATMQWTQAGVVHIDLILVSRKGNLQKQLSEECGVATVRTQQECQLLQEVPSDQDASTACNGEYLLVSQLSIAPCLLQKGVSLGIELCPIHIDTSLSVPAQPLNLTKS